MFPCTIGVLEGPKTPLAIGPLLHPVIPESDSFKKKSPYKIHLDNPPTFP